MNPLRPLLPMALLALLAPLAAAADVITTDGNFSASSRDIRIAVTEQGAVLQLGARKCPLSDLVLLDLRPAPQPTQPTPHILVLPDGTRLPGKLLATRQGKLCFESPALGPIELPLEKAKAVLFHDRLLTANERRAVEETLAQTCPVDRLLLDTGSDVRGVIEGLDDQQVEIQTETIGRQKVSRASLRGILLAELEPYRPPAGLRAVLHLPGGGRLLGAPLDVPEQGFRLQTSFLSAPVELSSSKVETLTVEGGRAVFLSDLQPARIQETPYFNPVFKRYLYADEAWAGGPLRLDGNVYVKGLGIHAQCRAVYDVPAGAKRFLAQAGLDDDAKSRPEAQPSVQLQVEAGGKILYDSGIIGAQDRAKAIRVDLNDAAQVTIIVNFGKNADIRARTAWGYARFEK